MNRIYRSIWNTTLGAWVAAPEIANTAGMGCASQVNATPADHVQRLPFAALAPVLRGSACGAVMSVCGLLAPAAAYAGAAATGDVTPVVNWGDANDLVVGDTAAGSLQIDPPGTAVRSASGWMGLTAGGVGTAKVSGLGAYWIMNGSLVIGASGSGTLTLANLGSVTVGTNGQGFAELARNPGAVGVINIGSAPGSVSTDAAGVLDVAEVRFGAGRGTLNFNSVSTVLFSSALVSSAAGRHQLNHYAGITQLLGDSARFNGDTTVSGGELRILNVLGTEEGRIDAGVAAGATARVKVSNSGSTWALTGNLFVGGAGPAELSVSNSGTVSNQFATVDALQNGVATVTVADAGSLWSNRAALLVGSEGGQGRVSILAGGYVTSNDGYIGRNQNGSGTVNVSGSGSAWVNGGMLRVGDVSGRGVLNIGAGGLVSNTDSFVGSVGGSGDVVVSGAGATWNNAGAMNLGFGLGAGAGTLTIADGGSVNVGVGGNGTVSLVNGAIFPFGGSGTLNIGAAVSDPAAGAGTLQAAALEFGAGRATLNFNHTDPAYRFATRLSSVGSGIHGLNQVAGTTLLTGANGAFLGKTTVSGGRLVVLGQLGGAAEVTGGTLQYGDGSVGAANRVAADLKVSGAGSTLAVQGPATLAVSGELTMADYTMLDLMAGASGVPLRANTVALGAGVGLRLGGINNSSTVETVLIDATTAINGDFASVSTGGALGQVDYLSVNTRKSPDGRQYLARYGLSWTANNSLAHGTFTLAQASESFDLNVALSNQASNTAWNGQTLTKKGAGTLGLNAANSFTGGVQLDEGRISLGHAQGLGSGALSMGDDTRLVLATDGMSIANALSIAGGSHAAIDTGGHDASWSAGITGGGVLSKEGVGSLELTGDSSGFAGRATVQAGTLAVAAHAKLGGALSVASGAMLTGTGTVGGMSSITTVQSGATIVPGDTSTPYGTLHVAGDLQLDPGANYQVRADPSALGHTSSRIDVAGKATLAGSVLHVGNEHNAGTDFQLGQTYTILTAGSLSGKFDTVASNYAYLDAALGYSHTDVTLQLLRKKMNFANLAETPNQAAVAMGVESLPSSHPLYQYVQGLPKGAPAAAFNSLSGDTHAGVAGSLISLSARAPSISSQHLYNNLTVGMRAGAPVAQSDGPLPASAWPSSKALPAWAEVVGHWQTYNGDGNAARLKQNTAGLFVGMDQEVAGSGWRLGGSLGYTHADGRVADRSSTSKVDSYSASVYGGKSFGTGMGPRINVLGGLAYTWHDIQTNRSVASLGQNLQADYSAHTAQLFAEVGYAIGQYDKFGLEPVVGVSLGQQRTGSFQERGGFAALQGRSSTDDLASTTLGLRMHSDFALAGKEGRLRATVGWRHALGDVATSKTMAFEGGQNFTVAGAPLARNMTLLGLEAEMALGRSAALVVGYRGEVGGGQRDHAASVKLRWAF